MSRADRVKRGTANMFKKIHIDRSFAGSIIMERQTYHDRQAFTGAMLRGVSGITARVAQYLADMQDEHRRQGRRGRSRRGCG